MADISTTLDYYENLLIIQYHNEPKAQSTINLLVGEALAEGIVLDVRDGYDVDTAIGAQLDILGEWVGVDRFYITFDYTDNYFGFADATNTGGVSANIVGFDDAASPDKSGFFLDASEVIQNDLRLNDTSFRILIKLKIVQNNSDHGMGDISAKLYDFFGDTLLLKDNYDMSMTYFIGDTSNALVRAALQKEVLPKPAGVRIEALDGVSFFGFADAENLDAINPFVKGFNDATTGFTQEGKFLNASSDFIT